MLSGKSKHTSKNSMFMFGPLDSLGLAIPLNRDSQDMEQSRAVFDTMFYYVPNHRCEHYELPGHPSHPNHHSGY